MKIWLLGLSMIVVNYLHAVTPQSVRTNKHKVSTHTVSTRTRSGKKNAPVVPQSVEITQEKLSAQNSSEQVRHTRRRSVAKKIHQQEIDAAVPVEHYNTDVLDQKEARKKYKQIKRNMARTTQAEYSDDVQGRTLSEMSYAQLCRRKNELILMGDYETAIRYLERMLRVIERPEQIVYIMLELGELFMKSGNYRKAERMYVDFVKLYPSNQFAEQAYVKAIEASWMQTLQPDRDQTKTESTIALIQEFLTRDALYSPDNVAQIMAINEKCHEKLAESSILIAQNYVVLGQYGAAHKRIEAIADQVAKLTSVEPKYLEVTIELAFAEGNHDKAKQLQADLQQRYPEHEVTLALVNKPNWKRWLGI